MPPDLHAVILDPSSVSRQLFSLYLRPYASSVATVASLLSADRWIEAVGAPDLVVADGQVDDVLRWLERLRAERPGVEFLVTTTSPDSSEESRFRSMGAIGYLPKPVAQNVFGEAISAWFFGSRDAASRAESDATATDSCES